MGQHETTDASPSENIERILWTARRAGRTLILSRDACGRTLDSLRDEGLVHERLGHIVLTHKGEDRRRRAAHLAVA